MADSQIELQSVLIKVIDIGASTSMESGVARRLYAIATSGSGAGGVTTVQGGETNNGAAPGSDNVGVLPAVATAAAPTYIEGNQVALSTNLLGQMRTLEEAGSTLNGFQSLNNRSDTPLLASATFTPASYDDLQALGWPTSIEVTVVSNVAGTTSSTTPAILLQWSDDASTIHEYDGARLTSDAPFGGRANALGTIGGISIPTGLRKTFTFFPTGLRYLKVLYVNGGTNQTLFILRTLYRYGSAPRALAHRYDGKDGSWEVEQSNEVYTDISSGSNVANTARTTGSKVNLMHAGVILSLIITAVPGGTPAGLDVSLEAGDSSSSFTRINAPLTGAYPNAVGTYRFLWHPNASSLNTGHNPGTVKQAVGFPFPRFWQVNVIPMDSGIYTFSLQSLYVVR